MSNIRDKEALKNNFEEIRRREAQVVTDAIDDLIALIRIRKLDTNAFTKSVAEYFMKHGNITDKLKEVLEMNESRFD